MLWHHFRKVSSHIMFYWEHSSAITFVEYWRKKICFILTNSRCKFLRFYSNKIYLGSVTLISGHIDKSFNAISLHKVGDQISPLVRFLYCLQFVMPPFNVYTTNKAIVPVRRKLFLEVKDNENTFFLLRTKCNKNTVFSWTEHCHWRCI